VFIAFRIPITWGLALSPFAILMLILLGIFIGLLLTPIGMLYTDISSGLAIVTNLWFFATPVVYPPPQSFPFSLLATLNPVSPLLAAARDLATGGILENAGAFAVVSAFTIVGLVFAWIMYRLSLPILIERMSA
jgi:lipopolysaccharide transport system permease protein